MGIWNHSQSPKIYLICRFSKKCYLVFKQIEANDPDAENVIQKPPPVPKVTP